MRRNSDATRAGIAAEFDAALTAGKLEGFENASHGRMGQQEVYYWSNRGGDKYPLSDPLGARLRDEHGRGHTIGVDEFRRGVRRAVEHEKRLEAFNLAQAES